MLSSKKDIYFISDLHFTVRVPIARTESTEEDWVEYQKGILQQVKAIVKEDLLVITGDLIDVALPYGSQTLVNMYVDHTPINTVFIPGNHELKGVGQDFDIAMEKGTLGNLVRAKGLHFLEDDKPYPWGEYLLHPYRFAPEKTIGHGEINKDLTNIVLGHFLSYENEVPFYVKEEAVTAKDIMKEFPEYDAYVVGDNHSTFLVDGKYLSPGSLTRRTTGQTKHKPCVWKYNVTEGFTPIYLDVPDWELCITKEHKIKADGKKEIMDSWAEDLKRSKEVTGDFEEDWRGYTTENKPEKQVVDLMDSIIMEVKLG